MSDSPSRLCAIRVPLESLVVEQFVVNANAFHLVQLNDAVEGFAEAIDASWVLAATSAQGRAGNWTSGGRRQM